MWCRENISSHRKTNLGEVSSALIFWWYGELNTTVTPCGQPVTYKRVFGTLESNMESIHAQLKELLTHWQQDGKSQPVTVSWRRQNNKKCSNSGLYGPVSTKPQRVMTTRETLKASSPCTVELISKTHHDYLWITVVNRFYSFAEHCNSVTHTFSKWSNASLHTSKKENMLYVQNKTIY